MPSPTGARLTPSGAWPPGTLGRVASPLLEDACGNRPGEAFERAAALVPGGEEEVAGVTRLADPGDLGYTSFAHVV
jgi:hypothetical protein